MFGTNLTRGHTTSCGCLVRHGMTGTPTHVSWEAMLQRCHNPRHRSYRFYGAIGVKVCERWRASFEHFLEDMGRRPDRAHSLDRFPNAAGDYEPGNCRWATRTEQHRNKKSNRLIEFRGEVRCAAEWAEVAGLSRAALYHRLRRGWETERMLTTRPVRA